MPCALRLTALGQVLLHLAPHLVDIQNKPPSKAVDEVDRGAAGPGGVIGEFGIGRVLHLVARDFVVSVARICKGTDGFAIITVGEYTMSRNCQASQPRYFLASINDPCNPILVKSWLVVYLCSRIMIVIVWFRY